MLDLTKSEYKILIKFYEVNTSLTKHELIDLYPELNKNTAASVIASLLSKNYLEISEIRFSKSVLARAYKPSKAFLLFLQAEYGFSNVDQLVQKIVGCIKDQQELELLLLKIKERKNIIENK